MSNPILNFAFNDLHAIRNLTITPNEVSFFAEKKGIELTESDVIDTIDNIRAEFLNIIEDNIEKLVVITKDIKKGKLYKYVGKSEILNGHSVIIIESLNAGNYKVKFLTGHAIDRFLEVKSNQLLPVRKV